MVSMVAALSLPVRYRIDTPAVWIRDAVRSQRELVERGQASIETTLLLPALLAVALACGQALLVGWTSISAEHAARAAARARLVGAVPRSAAADALPSV